MYGQPTLRGSESDVFPAGLKCTINSEKSGHVTISVSIVRAPRVAHSCQSSMISTIDNVDVSSELQSLAIVIRYAAVESELAAMEESEEVCLGMSDLACYRHGYPK